MISAETGLSVCISLVFVEDVSHENVQVVGRCGLMPLESHVCGVSDPPAQPSVRRAPTAAAKTKRKDLCPQQKERCQNELKERQPPINHQASAWGVGMNDDFTLAAPAHTSKRRNIYRLEVKGHPRSPIF
jgi:hypothetical protein